ncbi:MAG: hypothetical protein IKK73_03470 [Akkermansia sp.]|nr:hypothetical protein [Akkermansia sp.]
MKKPATKTMEEALWRGYVIPGSVGASISVSMAAALLSHTGYGAAVPVHPGVSAAVAVLVHPGMMLGFVAMLYHMGHFALPYVEMHLHIGSLGLSTQYEAGHTGQHSEFSEVFFHGLCFWVLCSASCAVHQGSAAGKTFYLILFNFSQI